MFGQSENTNGNKGGALNPPRHFFPWQLTSALAGGIAVLLVYSCASADKKIDTFTILFVLSGAAFLIGALIGFLFGIPKSRTDGGIRAAEGNPATDRYYSDNANLEEVSDWLTKIIVGLGLVELSRLGGVFEVIGEIAGSVLGPVGKIVLQGSIVYFLVLGFIFCYLWTRVVFYENLMQGEANRRSLETKVREIEAKADEKVVQIEAKASEDSILNALYTTIDLNGHKKYLDRDWGALNRLEREAEQIFKENVKNRKAAILTARFVSEIKHDLKDVEGNKLAIHRLDEFLDAKRQAKEFDRDFADVLYNRAGHAGRIIGAAASANLGAQELEKIKERTLADFAESVRLEPRDAQEALTDPDFASLLENPEFEKIVQGAKPAA